MIKIYKFILFSISILFSPIYMVSSQEKVPNEMGLIPILAYHKIGDVDREYTRSRIGFREDMLMLIQYGFYPISLDEFTSGNISTPKGKIPVLLTFDDSSISQFEYKADGTLDPNSAVGILEDLRKIHKGFDPKAVFFILPGAKPPNNYFGQNEFQQKKTDFLLKNGYEIQNHTLWHANLNKYSHLIEEQIVRSETIIRGFAPNHKVYALALPFGIYPPEKQRYRLMKGNYNGTPYENKLVFDFSNRMSFSPYSTKFDPLHVHRIHGNKTQMERFFKSIGNSKNVFVSDGNPRIVSIPRSLSSEIHPKWKAKMMILD